MSKVVTFFEPSSGRAVVSMDTNTTYLLEVKENGTVEGPRELPSTFKMHAWIELRQCETLDIDIGDYPFEQLQKYILFQTRLHQLVNWFGRSLNRTFLEQTRKQCANLFERYFVQATPEVILDFKKKARDILAQPETDVTNAPFKTGSGGDTVLRLLVANKFPLHEVDCLDKIPDPN